MEAAILESHGFSKPPSCEGPSAPRGVPYLTFKMALSKSITRKRTGEEGSDKIMIMPKDLLDCGEVGTGDDVGNIKQEFSVKIKSSLDERKPLSIVSLRHPKSGEKALYMFNTDWSQVYELVAYRDPRRSWFVDESVASDGSLIYVTQVDPVFLALPYLIDVQRKNKMFMTLDQIISDVKYPHTRTLLNTDALLQQLHNVCDIKGDENEPVYRYCEQKTLNWLKMKILRLVKYLESENVNISMGTKATSYITDYKLSQDEYCRYAYELVADYLSDELSQAVRKLMGIEDDIKKDLSPGRPPIKKQKLDASGKSKGQTEPLDDYSKIFKFKPDTKPNKAPSRSQKLLEQVDKSGMKNIASFFRPSSKMLKK